MNDLDISTLESANYAYKSGLEEIRYGQFSSAYEAVKYLENLGEDNKHLGGILNLAGALKRSLDARDDSITADDLKPKAPGSQAEYNGNDIFSGDLERNIDVLSPRENLSYESLVKEVGKLKSGDVLNIEPKLAGPIEGIFTKEQIDNIRRLPDGTFTMKPRQEN
jgi:hypothetical protein